MSKAYSFLFALLFSFTLSFSSPFTGEGQDSSTQVKTTKPSGVGQGQLRITIIPMFQTDVLAFSNLPYISFESSGGLVSNFLSKTLVTNSYWSSDILNAQFDQLSNQNRMGFDISGNAEVHLRNRRFGGSNWTPFVGVNHQFTSAFTADKSVVLTLLEGNKDNRTISFDKRSQFSQLQTTSLKFGVETVDSSYTLRNQISISLVGGHQYLDLLSSAGNVITDSSGEFISGNGTDIQYLSHQGSGLPGMGLALNYSIMKQFMGFGHIGVEIENLGVMRWSSLDEYVVTPDFVFSGLDVTNAVQNSGEVNLIDSLNETYLTETNGPKTTLLPFRATAKLLYPLGITAAIESELTYLNFPGYWPMLHANYKQRFTDKGAAWRLGARLGGFGNYGLNLGLSLPFNYSSGLEFQLVALESLASSNLPVYWYGNIALSFRL